METKQKQQVIKTKRKIVIRWVPILFLTPSIICYLLFKYYPTFRMIYISFFDYNIGNPPGKFVGLDNFIQSLTAATFWHAFGITLIFALLYLLLTFWIPIVQALLLNEIHRGNVLFRFIYQIPAIAPGVVTVLIWKFMYNPDFGVLNFYLGKIGLGPYLWLNDLHMVKFSIVMPSIFASSGISILLYFSAIRAVSQEILEAAKMDGAGPWRRITAIILPNIRFIILIQFIAFLTGALYTFDNIYVFTQGGPSNSTMVASILVFNSAFNELRFGTASAISFFLFIITAIITFIQLRLSRESD
ncbi:sugar ABC transporter permease [Paenibacillus psychroresistens]|uniref:Sugar ABC transporter permease n=2 Tax=Paenibacillus psychroresistens TaxID=1778678 RepID=A0A6B8RXN1_9BACL|nr:sugar ABC transporter permease [Paenibacillus psychroresistens]